MTYNEIRDTMEGWETMLSPKTRRRLHYRTMRNFVLHANEIEREHDRYKVLDLLEEYVEWVQYNEYSFDADSSIELAEEFMFPLVEYYRAGFGFLEVITFRSLIFGIVADSALYLNHFMSGRHYIPIPIVTAVIALYYSLLLIFYIPQGRVYGMYY